MTQDELREKYRKRFTESRELRLQQAAARNSVPPPDHLSAITREVQGGTDSEGFAFQPCGGGRRVIRKRIGGN